jgi:aspartyl-tRNA(Asn)/glutamyl-tRNA(Gln) amidotransferase subunit C
MAVSSDTIRETAQLARLRVEDMEIEDLTRRFSAILDLFGELQATDTTGVEPMAHPLDATQTLREDVVTEANQRDALQSVAPLVEDGLYLVPRVVE